MSFGAGCAQRNLPGVYTNVAAYSTWIRNIIGGDRENEATSTASSKPHIAELVSSAWGISILAALAALCFVLAVGLVIALSTYL